MGAKDSPTQMQRDDGTTRRRDDDKTARRTHDAGPLASGKERETKVAAVASWTSQLGHDAAEERAAPGHAIPRHPMRHRHGQRRPGG